MLAAELALNDPLLIQAFVGALCASSAATACFLSDESFPSVCFALILLMLGGYVLMGLA